MSVNRQVTLAIFVFAIMTRFASPGLLASSSSSSSSSPADFNVKNAPIIYVANVNATYRDPVTGEQRNEVNDGWFSSENRIGPSRGWLQVARSANNRTDGCDPVVNRVDGWWVALVERGRCRFHRKIENAAVFNNASAVIVYNNEHDGQINMQHSVEDVVAIFLRRNDGLRLVQLMENGTRVFVTITPGTTLFPGSDQPSRTSVVFLFVSFVVLAVVSLLWLVFYYVQRFRVHGSLGVERARKNKIAKQLNRAAKMVVSKMEQKVLKPEDPELLSEEMQVCAVCVEEYKVNDKIRILPCRHIFHKKCVDQWLQDKRRCPICQLDILKTAGIQIPEEFQNLNTNNNNNNNSHSNNNNNGNANNGNNIRTSTSNDDDDEDDNDDSVASRGDDAVLVSVVPGRSDDLYLTYADAASATARDDERPRATVAATADDASDTTYHSDESLTDAFDDKNVVVVVAMAEGEEEEEEEEDDDDDDDDGDDEEEEIGGSKDRGRRSGGLREGPGGFESRLSPDTLSLPSRATSTSSSSSSTFDIMERRKGVAVAVPKRNTERSNNSSSNNTGNSNNNNNNNNSRSSNDNNNLSTTSINSRLTAVSSASASDDDDDDDIDCGDSPSSSEFSSSKYYDCRGEAFARKPSRMS